MKFKISEEKLIKIYVASPYTIGNKDENVLRQIEMGDILMDLNFSVYLPLLTHYQHIIKPRPEVDWLTLDFQWLRVCDAIIRIKPIIDGKELPSSGADMEEEEANKLKIPVFYTVEDLCKHFGKEKEYKNWIQNKGVCKTV